MGSKKITKASLSLQVSHDLFQKIVFFFKKHKYNKHGDLLNNLYLKNKLLCDVDN